MVGSYVGLLNRTIHLLNDAGPSPSLKISRVLRLLQGCLELRDAVLLIRSDRGARFDLQIRARARCALPSAVADPVPFKPAQLRRGLCLQGEDLILPLKQGRRVPAVVVLQGCPAGLEAEREFLEALRALLLPVLIQLQTDIPEASDEDRQLEELTLLNRLSRAFLGTLKLDERVELMLAALSMPEGGFERAMLFMVNERSGSLQGMLGMTRSTALQAFPGEADAASPSPRSAARQSGSRGFSLRVRQQRLPLDPERNALARSALRQQIFFVDKPEKEPPQAADMAMELGLSAYVCLPLYASERTRAVIVLDNPLTRRRPRRKEKRFLELFAKQAGQALENALLVQRLEDAHNELRATQEELVQGEKLATIGEMAASVAHELKNPLVVIGGFAKRLERITAADAKASQYAGTIAREVARLEEMLANILAFSKKSMACLGLCDPEEIVSEALALGRGEAEREDIVYDVMLEKGLPSFQGDEQKLRQMLVNLIINARQILNGEGTIALRGRRGMLRGDEAVVFEVTDTGGGIPPGILRNIFNPFFTTREEGTGLGLSIVQRIVEQHHGHIEVENAERGARFRVSIPLRQPHGRSH